MGTLRQLFKLRRTAWSLVGGLLLVGLLGGCSTPFIDIDVSVQVDTCPSGAGGPRQPLPEPGACTNGGTGSIPPPPATICKNASGAPMNCPTGATCTSGYKCGSPPGTENRKTCKTIWTQISGTSGSCICTGYY